MSLKFDMEDFHNHLPWNYNFQPCRLVIKPSFYKAVQTNLRLIFPVLSKRNKPERSCWTGSELRSFPVLFNPMLSGCIVRTYAATSGTVGLYIRMLFVSIDYRITSREQLTIGAGPQTWGLWGKVTTLNGKIKTSHKACGLNECLGKTWALRIGIEKFAK